MSAHSNLLTVFRPDVLAMHAYHVQDAAGYIKLDAMENPFALPPELQTVGRTPGPGGAEPLPRYPHQRLACRPA